MEDPSGSYNYNSTDLSWSNSYIWPSLKELIEQHLSHGDTIIDIGCGNGSTAGLLADLGYSVVGVDPSESGIEVARGNFRHVKFYKRSAYDNLQDELGEFNAVVSLEVVEHCFWPRKYAQTIFDMLPDGGVAFISTPFHGYWKNLALAITGKFDFHWNPLWDGGHIKFWSESTLLALLEEIGFVEIEFRRVGRIQPLAKSMIAIARKPIPANKRFKRKNSKQREFGD